MLGDWSSQCTGPVNGEYTYDKAFDGDILSSANRCVPAQGGTVSFIPQDEISGAVSVWVTMSLRSLPANSLTVNGNDYTALLSAAFTGNVDEIVLVQLPENSINNSQGVTWTSSGFIGGIVGLAGIEIEGTLLVDQ